MIQHAAFLDFCKRMGLPAPVCENKFHPVRKWRQDFAWPEYKLCLEVQGGIWAGGRHNSAKGYLKDMEKSNACACLGWRILQVTPKGLCTLGTYALVKEAMAAELPRPIETLSVRTMSASPDGQESWSASTF